MARIGQRPLVKQGETSIEETRCYAREQVPTVRLRPSADERKKHLVSKRWGIDEEAMQKPAEEPPWPIHHRLQWAIRISLKFRIVQVGLRSCMISPFMVMMERLSDKLTNKWRSSRNVSDRKKKRRRLMSRIEG
jgi:hypothetical protein